MNTTFRFARKVIDALPPNPPGSRSREAEYSDSETPGLKLLVSRSGRKFFYFRYTLRGSKRSAKLGEYPSMDVQEARTKALEMRAAINRGDDPREVIRPAEPKATLLLREFALGDYMTHARASKRSAKDDACRLRARVLPVLGDKPLTSITTLDVQKLHNDVKMTRRPSTANRVLALVKRMFNLAILWQLAEHNPAVGIRMHQENNVRQRYLSSDEIRRLFKALDEDRNQTLAAAIKFLLLTGVRRQEALDAKWEHVDFERKTLFLPTPKSGKSRHVLMSDAAVELLRAQPQKSGNPYVFPGRRLGRPIIGPTKAFERILARAGISDLRIHDLRHSFASIAISNGASLFEVQNLLAHQDSKTTMRYAHLSQDNLRRVNAVVAEVVSSALLD